MDKDSNANDFVGWLKNSGSRFHSVVPFDPVKDRLLLLDFTEKNSDLAAMILNDTKLFSEYINDKLREANAKYGIGGYDEHRTIYSRSGIFDGEEPRRLHLGIDIWGDAGTPVYCPIQGSVHSFAYNSADGDYGATLILEHETAGFVFHTLYGHLNLASVQGKMEGQLIEKGEWIAAFGPPAENGNWPPHLHFQLIMDMKDYKGDYPGVCRFSERQSYLENSPDPDLVLRMMQFAGKETERD
jgi:murein DD-endopeptidase MepM/ murein hydrolase activator NlpD